ncbi:MAG: methylase, partial [Clostridia bacterium]|nr:methylase [Clostridia bacterium]
MAIAIRKMTDSRKKEAAREFAERWADRGYEKGEAQSFWIDLLQSVFGVEDVAAYIQFEKAVRVPVTVNYTKNTRRATEFIDGYILSTLVLIEQKGASEDLLLPQKKSSGVEETPYEQAFRYAKHLPHAESPRWIILCNFREFYIHDLDNPGKEPSHLLLSELPDRVHVLGFLVDRNLEPIDEIAPSFEAGTLMGRLYDALRPQYADPDSAESLNSLSMLCVRLVFCLYAEDSDLFPEHLLFNRYMRTYSASTANVGLETLFYEILNKKPEDRNPEFNPLMKSFPYVDGGLFQDTGMHVPPFTDGIMNLLLHDVSEKFDWLKISPTIFGALFESTLNPDTRASNGMHYTSVENIHKVIDPLFMNDLEREYMLIMQHGDGYGRRKKLEAFRDKLASLRFLDPACGSGNFLTETYISLRRLENKALSHIYGGKDQIKMVSAEDMAGIIKVNISQFYGFEINGFAVTIAKTALWIAESQMMRETEAILKTDIDFLPIRSSAKIVECNALGIDWEDEVPKAGMSYIIGNPPFQGARVMNQSQKDDVKRVFGKRWDSAGDLDYVACWFKKCSDFMKGTRIRSALVATNSLCQGASVANLWSHLFEDGVHIDFAYRTFRWDSEATVKAHVHCVIVGFSRATNPSEKYIYDGEKKNRAENINGYLEDEENHFVKNRSAPICDVPAMGIGNMPIDDGNYLFSEAERDEFVKKESEAEKYFRPWYGAEEFINRKPRWCLWLGECTPAEIVSMPQCERRVKAVKEFRESSDRPTTRKLAERPT